MVKPKDQINKVHLMEPDVMRIHREQVQTRLSWVMVDEWCSQQLGGSGDRLGQT